MKKCIIFFIKSVAVILLLTQTTISDTGYQFIGNPIDEPILLTLCGVALLALGLYQTKSRV